MAGRLAGKVASITGAARGAGRSHAIRLAEEGADIVAADTCCQIASGHPPIAAPEDLAETVRPVEGLDRRIFASEADARDQQCRTVPRLGRGQLRDRPGIHRGRGRHDR
jgi:NAD(P)-dependent dehydrogenase (short-subunit alcohol dehydrogenase family)